MNTNGDSAEAPSPSVSVMPYRKYFCLLAFAWSVAVAASLGWNLLHNRQEVKAITFRTAQALLEKDLLYREWSILHGGVYIPKSSQPDPGDAARDEEREITTPSGQRLTLLNPAIVSRQIFDLQNQQTGIRGRITSLQPLRPENQPDDWERKALNEFSQGSGEVVGIEQYQGERCLRMMRPLYIVDSCLRCHEEQGRKPGELRGGISVTLPLKNFVAKGENLHLTSAHLGLWGIGIAGLVLGLKKLEYQASQRRRAEEVLRDQYELTATLTRNASTAIFLQDREGRCTMMNPAAESMTGYRFEEVRGKSLHDTIHKSRLNDVAVAQCDCPIVRAGEDRQHLHNHEAAFIRKDQTILPVLCSASPILKDGELTGVVLEAQDISDRKRAEEKTQAALREKEALLQEIHHRVKNNLQVISSLLQLQINEINDPQTLEVFRESQLRIRSMALIHEKLYESDSLARIDLADYLRSLTSLLFSTYKSRGSRVELVLNLSPVFVSIDAAIPLGLIANELVTNTLKFAFPNGRHGVIRVELESLPDYLYRFRLADDGVGLPAGYLVGEGKSLGMRLVKMLTAQLKAEGTWETPGPGTCFTLLFRDRWRAAKEGAKTTAEPAGEQPRNGK